VSATGATAERILVVDDEPDIVALVAYHLAKSGYRVSTASSGTEALEAARRDRPALVVLDLMLPGMSGYDVLEQLRADDATRDVGVLMLTARREEPDRIRGLSLGADDYLTKPFSPRELLARIRALLRRSKAQQSVANEIAKVRAYRFGEWELSIGLRRLKHRDGRQVELTNGEFSLLAAFLSAPQRVLTRDQLLDLSRLHNAEVYDRSIDVQILRLRRKIEADPAHPGFITTQRGAGYVFAAEVEALR
jgi:two-component system, OmpR family, response regulator